jgi:hypothetical protein
MDDNEIFNMAARFSYAEWQEFLRNLEFENRLGQLAIFRVACAILREVTDSVRRPPVITAPPGLEEGEKAVNYLAEQMRQLAGLTATSAAAENVLRKAKADYEFQAQMLKPELRRLLRKELEAEWEAEYGRRESAIEDKIRKHFVEELRKDVLVQLRAEVEQETNRRLGIKIRDIIVGRLQSTPGLVVKVRRGCDGQLPQHYEFEVEKRPRVAPAGPGFKAMEKAAAKVNPKQRWIESEKAKNAYFERMQGRVLELDDDE